jgi:hypothetical protein
MAIKRSSSTSSEVDAVRKSMLPIEDIKNFSRDVLTAILERAGKHKDSLLESVSTEVANFLTKVNVSEEVRKILEGMTIKVEATVKYDKSHPNKPSLKIKTGQRTKSQTKKKRSHKAS